MLFSSLDSLLKLSKTTSPTKLFDYDCVTLYLHINVYMVQIYIYLYPISTVPDLQVYVLNIIIIMMIK